MNFNLAQSFKKKDFLFPRNMETFLGTFYLILLLLLQLLLLLLCSYYYLPLL